ncbi:type 1 glutamine amidotransferase domain-containing protein [Marinagarivorans cellulosilyticus]|uniref:DJ-1/PfpI domain-containing protein n=1 Tax=Marinagarivorans cellulosilyticus TaxID=2721545 RepID=A0AAN1WKC9_9GAMM|nr:type 1 glutamine amidotransferase domain-containing protein [Marinagarivorans cellulosilyticus]BCD99187.1 hypothetical protein MARGE09_P3388 [Marinagarivorans cellulosilyticus]
MFKKVAVWFGVFIVCCVVAVISTATWLSTLMMGDALRESIRNTQASDLAYVNNEVKGARGRILAVLTSTGSSAIPGKNLGYELTELSRAYYVFQTNGFEVDVASTLGGEPEVVIDGDDIGVYDYAFLNDAAAQAKVANTTPIANVNAEDYAAIYFVGGKGALFDFPDNKTIQSVVRHMFQKGKVVGAICHGPAALLNVELSNGDFLLAGKQVTGFTNAEELFLMPSAKEVFPFLLESELKRRNARFFAGPLYLDNIVTDGKLITGQNPWSVWRTADAMISALGYTPVSRAITSQERAINVLMAYQDGGNPVAQQVIDVSSKSCVNCLDGNLIVMHALVAALQGKIGKTIDLIALARRAKKHAQG